MKTGRAHARCPIDAPSKIGRTGNVQGAAMVKMPANKASSRSGIGLHRIRQTCWSAAADGYFFISSFFMPSLDAFGPLRGYPEAMQVDGIPLRDQVFLDRDLAT
jgi:hypothetical protein